MQAAKSGSKRAQKDLDDAPKLSKDLQYLWHMFLDLYNAGNGTITYADIKAYAELQCDVTPFEVEAIQSMNRLRAHHG